MCFHMGVRLQEGREELRLEIGVGLFLRSGDHDEFARTFFRGCTSFLDRVLYTPGLVKNHISQKVFITSFYESHFPHKSVN